ncbi:hypothetical protein Zmor_024756 [Zophobas morio]|uniref:Nuclear condensin complex subunit 3 C-terminal domain-containing protein n=1 Tax=Zophobas morio TaxID=2755281 RepID=A0AA38M8Z4_9CUCU|nr:hypothetical protein Zmor_024756 [Zophobas morio]
MDIDKVEVSNVSEIFDLIQLSSACHLKYALKVKKSIETDPDDELLPLIYKWLQYAFLVDLKEKNVYLDRIINFTVTLATSFKCRQDRQESDESVQIHPILTNIFNFILELSNSTVESHRYWSCTLFNRIFKELEELTEELYENITESMLKRLKDGKAAIRCQAIVALHRLQDPTDKQDPIISEFCELLDSDFNARVRQLCVEKLALNKESILFVINRTRDVDANVRLSAFEKLKSVAKYLKVTQKRDVLQCGLYDSSEKIKKFTTTVLLQYWLESYDDDYLKLIESIRLDACEEDIRITVHLVEQILKALFKSASLDSIVQHISVNDEKIILYENLTWEIVLYYRIVVQFLRQSQDFEDALNNILPELVHFCRYIKGYCDFMKQNEHFYELQYEFTLQQFFLITLTYDVSDTASRRCLNSLAHSLLQNEDMSADLAELVMRNLEKVIPNVNDRSVFVCEMISNIMYSDELGDYEELERKEKEKKHAISQLQSDIISLQEQENRLVHVERNFIEAERVKQEIETNEALLQDLRSVQEKPEPVEKKTDAKTMLKCLNIAEALLRSPTIRKFNPAIATLNNEVINQALVHEDDLVKLRALKCYALCCVIDYRTARYGVHLFSGLMFTPDTDAEVLIISLKVIVDLLTIYGLALVEKNEDEEEEASDSRREEEKKIFLGGTSLTDLIQALADHLEHEDPQVQVTATTGVCILLQYERITSSSLLSRIIIKWANPATDNERLKQFIGLSLNALTRLSNCHTYFDDAVLNTIRTLVYAPRTSALKDIDLDNTVKFMVTLCAMPRQGKQIHSNLAFKICNQMREKPRHKVNLYFSKVLVLLVVPENSARDELLSICDELRDVIQDKTTLKNINKFNTNLSKSLVKLQPVEEEGAIN